MAVRGVASVCVELFGGLRVQTLEQCAVWVWCGECLVWGVCASESRRPGGAVPCLLGPFVERVSERTTDVVGDSKEGVWSSSESAKPRGCHAACNMWV